MQPRLGGVLLDIHRTKSWRLARQIGRRSDSELGLQAPERGSRAAVRTSQAFPQQVVLRARAHQRVNGVHVILHAASRWEGVCDTTHTQLSLQVTGLEGLGPGLPA